MRITLKSHDPAFFCSEDLFFPLHSKTVWFVYGFLKYRNASNSLLAFASHFHTYKAATSSLTAKKYVLKIQPDCPSAQSIAFSATGESVRIFHALPTAHYLPEPRAKTKLLPESKLESWRNQLTHQLSTPKCYREALWAPGALDGPHGAVPPVMRLALFQPLSPRPRCLGHLMRADPAVCEAAHWHLGSPGWSS